LPQWKQALLDAGVKELGPPQHEIVVERMVQSTDLFPLPELPCSLQVELVDVEEGERVVAAAGEEDELWLVRFSRAAYCSSVLHFEGDYEPQC